jgi:hypothetical protein
MREASINIKYSQFVQCTQDILTEAQVKDIFRRASKYRPCRVMLKTQSAEKKIKVEAVLRPCDEVLFNNILSSRRLAADHKFIVMGKHDSDWSFMMTIAADAHEFSDLYAFTPAQGYLVYIDTGMKLMGKQYSLSKFKYYKTKIFDLQQQKVVVANDPDPALTDKVYKYFIRLSNIRDTNAYKSKYVANMVYICDCIRESGVRYDKYLEAQFEFWKGFNKFPEPSWCHTRDAIDRVLKLKKV